MLLSRIRENVRTFGAFHIALATAVLVGLLVLLFRAYGPRPIITFSVVGGVALVYAIIMLFLPPEKM